MRCVAIGLAFAMSFSASPAGAQEDPGDPGVPLPAVNAPPPPPEPPPVVEPALQPPPPGMPPPGVRYVTQRRWGLFATGSGIFGSTWLGNMVTALTAERYEALAPVVGPFLLIDNRNGTGSNVLLALDGAAQAAGITLMILGVTLTKKIPVYAVVPTANGIAIAGLW